MAIWVLLLVMDVGDKRIEVSTKTIQRTQGPEPGAPTFVMMKVFFNLKDVSNIVCRVGEFV